MQANHKQTIINSLLTIGLTDYLTIMSTKHHGIGSQINSEELLPFVKCLEKDFEVTNIETGLHYITTQYSKWFSTDITAQSIIIEHQPSLKAISQVRHIEELNLQRLSFNYHQLPLNEYTEFLHDIRTTKIAPGFNGNPPKIYKYILVLSLLDFFYDQDSRLSPFNKAVPIDELVIYYKLNLADDLYGNLIENKKVVYGNDKFIKNHIQTMPLRKLCNNSSYFRNDDRNPKSRKTEDLPTQFAINKPSALDDAILAVLLRNTCNQLIISKTGISTVLNQVQVIKQAEQSTTENTTYTSVVRRGQQQYRQSLLERYNNSCALCSIDFNPMLVASHAKPWKSCQTVHERLSPNNGLLLCSQHDSLFDKGYIAFDIDNNYQLLLSNQLTETVKHQLQFIDKQKLVSYMEQHPKMQKYLDYHKHHIFKG